jgi:hypothetical protein
VIKVHIVVFWVMILYSRVADARVSEENTVSIFVVEDNGPFSLYTGIPYMRDSMKQNEMPEDVQH